MSNLWSERHARGIPTCSVAAGMSGNVLIRTGTEIEQVGWCGQAVHWSEDGVHLVSGGKRPYVDLDHTVAFWTRWTAPKNMDDLIGLIEDHVRRIYGCDTLKPGVEPLPRPDRIEMIRHRLAQIDRIMPKIQEYLDKGKNRDGYKFRP